MAPIGAAVLLPHMETLRDWLFDTQRPIEIQDFVVPNLGDPADLITRWRAMLDGHTGPRGIHGPFFGIDLANPDREIRAVLTRRLVQGVGAGILNPQVVGFIQQLFSGKERARAFGMFGATVGIATASGPLLGGILLLGLLLKDRRGAD